MAAAPGWNADFGSTALAPTLPQTPVTVSPPPLTLPVPEDIGCHISQTGNLSSPVT